METANKNLILFFLSTWRSALQTQKLLKVAVSYRFASYYYSGNPEAKNASCQGTANDDGFRLIREMVCCIVSEYNLFRKELKMAYNEVELETGIPQL